MRMAELTSGVEESACLTESVIFYGKYSLCVFLDGTFLVLDPLDSDVSGDELINVSHHSRRLNVQQDE